jgi:hypothetical protein
MSDDATRRQLKFSLFLQAFAALMLGLAAGVRLAAFGFDLVSAVLIIAILIVLGAGWFTWKRMRAITPG